MNSTVSENQTSSLAVKCTDSESTGIALFSLNFIIILPFQVWVLWVGIRNCRMSGHFTASEIFTMNLSAIEFIATITCTVAVAAFAINNREIIHIVFFFSGSYLVGRPVMNSLICVERYMAVARPVMYLNPAFVKHRYIAAGLVWMLTVAYGGLTVYNYPRYRHEVYILALSMSILVISACSLGVLKILLRPSPGETQNDRMDHQKKRAFVIITGILVCISVPYGLDLFLFCIRNYISNHLVCVLLDINMWLLQQGSIVNPLLYLSKHGKFSFISKLFKTARNVEATSS